MKLRSGWGVSIAYAVVVAATQMLWLTFAPIDTDVARDFHTSQSAIGWLAFDHTGSPETFFSAGGLLLVGSLALGLAWLRRVAARSEGLTSLPQLGRRNAARRRGRGLPTGSAG